VVFQEENKAEPLTNIEETMSNIGRISLKFLAFLGVVCLFSCYPALKKEPKSPEEALVPVEFFYPTFRDDIQLDSLVLAIKRNIQYLNRLEPEEVFIYGPDRFSSLQVKESQQAFLELITGGHDLERLNKELRSHFKVYRAAGRVGNSKVLFTGYFEPVFDARLRPDDCFKYPIYRRPDDLTEIDLSPFGKDLDGQKIIARIDGREVLPYYSRYQIEVEEVLRGRSLEIAWLKDPVDVTFLQIQGSGRLLLANGDSMSVGYIASNGLPYRSIGGYMLNMGYLTKEELSMQAIRRYLAANPRQVREILNHNPSYVFFQVLDNGPLGSINIPVTPGRSLALDSKLFPKGALAFISCQKPVIDHTGRITAWTPFSRFTLNQDSGGAIKGAGRADLFLGSGPYAEIAAGHLRHEGDLYILIKKP
jgi:membrane-bound lytic murein transglycosylase A